MSSATATRPGFFASIGISLRLTAASIKLVLQYPKVLILPFLTVLAVSTLVIVPLALVIWGVANHPASTATFFSNLYFITTSAYREGNLEWAITSAVVETYVLFSLWMIPVLTSVMYFCAVGMDVAVQQVRRQTPSLSGAFRVVNGRFWKIVLLATFTATVYTWVHYLLSMVLRPIPFVGRWIMRGLNLVLTAVSYLMLPIVVYESAGPASAFRSAWRCVKKTWSGLLIGTGAAFFGVLVLTEIVITGVARQVLGLDDWIVGVLSLVIGAALYALSTSVAAALRGVLYLYATTGEVPPGFEAKDLPRVEEPAPFTSATQPAAT